MKRGRRKHFAALVAAVAVTGLAFAGTAQASVTIGSSLAATPAGTAPAGCNSFPCTAVNNGLNASATAPDGLWSPVNGTVTSWRMKSNSAGFAGFRVLTSVGGTTFTGGPDATPEPVTAGGISGPFADSQPIKIGDSIGLNSQAGMLDQAVNPGASQVSWFNPTLSEGATLAGNAGGGYEVLVQATIEPTNAISFGKVRKNKKNGKAIVTMTVPNPGTLLYTHKGIKVVGPPTVTAPGDVQLVIKPKANIRRKLDEKGKARVGFNVRFTPTGGTLATQHENVKLLKKH